MLLFKPVTSDDFPLLLGWLAKPHVKEWWDDGDDTLEKVAQHYGAPSATTKRFIIIQHDALGTRGEHAVGYLQYYLLADNGAGIDVFIGEEHLLGKGLGPQIIHAFLELLVTHHNPAYILVDPSPSNERAIRCYEKIGFRYDATVATNDGKQAYLMKINMRSTA